MGGRGSGAYGFRGPLERRKTIEETPSLNISGLTPHLDNCKLTWSYKDQSVTIFTNKKRIILAYTLNNEKIVQPIKLEYTKVGFGKRAWFKCHCGKKRARLYLVDGYFKCRDCHNLTYRTCQESGDPLDYLALKIRRRQRELGLDGHDIHELPFFKPKNMHWDTFSWLRRELELMQMARTRHWMSKP